MRKKDNKKEKGDKRDEEDKGQKGIALILKSKVFAYVVV